MALSKEAYKTPLEEASKLSSKPQKKSQKKSQQKSQIEPQTAKKSSVKLWEEVEQELADQKPEGSEPVDNERIPRSYHKGGSQRFEMFLPPTLVADLQLMKAMTGNSFAAYIRRAVERALAEDKTRWDSNKK
jgi:hypothetical protein